MKNLLYREPRFKGIRHKTLASAAIVILVAAIPVSILWSHKAVDDHWSRLQITQGSTQEYKIPELAPLPEREANITLIKKIWGRDAQMGLAIARAESGYRTHATHANTNGTLDEGIFQINSIHKMPDMLTATANIAFAYTMYIKQGSTPWNSSKHNWSVELASK